MILLRRNSGIYKLWNEVILINYVIIRIRWNRNKIDIVDIFVYNVVFNITDDSEDYELMFIEKCRRKDDWLK